MAKRKNSPKGINHVSKGQTNSSTRSRVLDLHGRTQEEIFDLVDRYLLSEVRKGASQTRIMTGKGKGLVQKQVVDYLQKAGYHWVFDKLGSGRPNEGVLLIFLD